MEYKCVTLSDVSSLDMSLFFNEGWEIYRYSFPRCERRTLEEQRLKMADERYRFEVAIDGNMVVGIVCYWIFIDQSDGSKYLYLEHLATSKSIRNCGFGAKCLEYLKSFGYPILLEIEPPEDDLTRRRQGFYERAGFRLNKYDHIHSPYRIDEGAVELKIMTYPEEFSTESYESFRRSQTEIMPKWTNCISSAVYVQPSENLPDTNN